MWRVVVSVALLAACEGSDETLADGAPAALDAPPPDAAAPPPDAPTANDAPTASDAPPAPDAPAPDAPAPDAPAPDASPPIDECTEGLAGCDANATCVDLVAGFECTCNAGYGGDGFLCTTGFARATGSPGHDDIVSVTGASGDVTVFGYAAGTIDLGGAPITVTGLYAARYDTAGGHLWSRPLASAAGAESWDVAEDAAGDILIAGSFDGSSLDLGTTIISTSGNRDGFIAKLSSADGTVLWARALGGPHHDQAHGVEADGTDAVVVGIFQGTANFGGGPLMTASAGDEDFFLARYSSTGDHLLSMSVGSDTADERAWKVAIDPVDGAYLVAGWYTQNADLGFGPEPSPFGDTEAFVARYTASGVPVWREVFAFIGGEDFAAAVQVDGFGDVVMAFNSRQPDGSSATDAYLVKRTAAGDDVFRFSVGGPDFDEATGLDVASNGDFVLAGWFQGVADLGSTMLIANGPRDGFVAGYLASGMDVWSATLGGADFDRAVDVSFGLGGLVVVSGVYVGTTELGGMPFPSYGGRDVFLVGIVP